MATTGSSPMQDFIRNMMEVKQYQLQQQAQVNQAAQFAEQQALAQRQLENSEIEAFAQMAGKVRNPQELTSLASYFAQRSPGQAPVFEQLASNIAPAMQTQLDNAMYRAGPAAIDQALAISQDRILGATGQQRGQQFSQEFGLRERQFEDDKQRFGLTFAEGRRQFDQSYGQRERQFGQQMGFNYTQLGQQYELGYLGAQSPVERFMTSRGTLSAEANRLRAEMNKPLSADARATIQRQLSDVEKRQAQLDAAIAAEMAGRGGGGAGGMDMNQLFTAEASAWQDINEATDLGTKESAIARYNRLRGMMPQPGPRLMYQDTWQPWDAGVRTIPTAPSTFQLDPTVVRSR